MRPYPIRLRPLSAGSQHLGVSVDVPGGCIRVTGDLDRSSAHHVVDALSALRSSPAPVWTLDLHGVAFCDVEGLRILSGAADFASRCGRGLQLSRIPDRLGDLLAVYRSARLAHGGPPVTRPPVVAAAC